MKSIQYSTLLAAVLCGSTASADVTAQQVWDNWTEQMAVYGQGFTTTGETMSGDTLTISGVKIEMADEEASVLAELGDINLTENGDGTVTITVPESYPITLDFTPEFGGDTSIDLSVTHVDMNLTVSGDPDAMVYDISADRYAISVVGLEGNETEDVDLEDAVIAMIDIAGQYSVKEDNLTRIAYAFEMGALDIDVLFREIGGDGIVSFNGDIADLGMLANIDMPIDMDMDAEEPPFADGLAMDGGYTFGNVSYVFDIDVDGEAASGEATVDGGELAFSFDIDGMAYTGGSRGIAVSMLIPEEFPLPIEASMAKYGFDFVIPLSQGDGPRDARMAFNFTELAISDMLWGLGDPQGILPRDPVTVALGIDAQVTPFFDFLDPSQQQAAMMSDIPGELNGAQITELTIKAAGAEITGDGAFTFDNTDLETFDGLPRPEGEVNFAINGVNGLIDKLIQMGLIPEEKAMMPRMMMGMFTTPVGDDMLTSTIEINAEGQILANGQRLR